MWDEEADAPVVRADGRMSPRDGTPDAAVEVLVRESASGWRCERVGDAGQLLALMRRAGSLWVGVVREHAGESEGFLARNDVARLAEDEPHSGTALPDRLAALVRRPAPPAFGTYANLVIVLDGSVDNGSGGADRRPEAETRSEREAG